MWLIHLANLQQNVFSIGHKNCIRIARSASFHGKTREQELPVPLKKKKPQKKKEKQDAIASQDNY